MQRYKCNGCNRKQQAAYRYAAYRSGISDQIVLLTKEGLGIRSMARVLRISTPTLLKRIRLIASAIRQPLIPKGKTFEVDEMCTYVSDKRKLTWIAYALQRETGNVVSYAVGARTNRTLNRVLDTLKLYEAKMICTDGLKNYRYMIEKEIHSVRRFGTNRIERKNLSIRTALKRLGRRTLCFSKSRIMLSAILKIYFWG